MPNDNYPFHYGDASADERLFVDGYPSSDKTVVNGPYVGPRQVGLSINSNTPAHQQGAHAASPGSTAPQFRVVQDAPTVQMRCTAAVRQTSAAQRTAYGPRTNQQSSARSSSASAYDPDTYDPSPAQPDRAARQTSRRETSRQMAAQQPRRGASALRWIARILCLGLLVFGAMTVFYLTEQSVAETSALSSNAGSLAEYGAYLVQSGQLPTFEENPIKWTAAHILLLSVKFSNHGLSVRQQAHVVEFALLGGVVALNVLAWMSGWAHRRGQFGRLRIWRTWLMYALSMSACASASFADQYHKLYVPGRHFDKLDLFLDASGYIMTVTCVFIAWSIGSAVYRLVFRK